MDKNVNGAPVYDYALFPRQFISYRWFKPILVGILTAVFMVIFQLGLFVLAVIWTGSPDFINTISTGYDDMNVYSGPGALVELGGVAVLLPALALAALIVRDRPFSSYSSSRGGWNWGAFAKCLGVSLALYGILTLVQIFLFPDEKASGINSFTIAGFILCTAILPFQCLAEEYIFRGLILQGVSSWFKVPIVGIAIAAIVFAAGHPYNLTGMIVIFVDGLVWGFIAWRSRGIEATSAAHIVNNYIAFYLSGFGLSAITSEIDPASLVFAIIIDVVYAALILGLGKKFNWFTSKGDGAAAFNEKRREKMTPPQSDLPIPPTSENADSPHFETPQPPMSF